MSKLCLLVLGVLSIAALAAAWDHQDDTSLSEDLANSRLVRSPEAAAKKKRKNKPKRSGGKLKKGRKSKSGKRSSRRKTRRGGRQEPHIVGIPNATHWSRKRGQPMTKLHYQVGR